MRTMNKIALLAASVLALTGCTSANLGTNTNACYIMYDAGSSGTRLYVYEQAGSQLIEHEGPKVAALADPVRSFRGKTPADIGAVTDEVVGALDLIKAHNGFQVGESFVPS